MEIMIVAGLFMLFLFSLSQIKTGRRLFRFFSSLCMLVLSVLLWPFFAVAEAMGWREKPPPPPPKRKPRRKK